MARKSFIYRFLSAALHEANRARAMWMRRAAQHAEPRTSQYFKGDARATLLGDGFGPTPQQVLPLRRTPGGRSAKPFNHK